MSRRELRIDVALAILTEMVPTRGTKYDKVAAAFEYADMFLHEMDVFDRKHEGLKGHDRT